MSDGVPGEAPRSLLFESQSTKTTLKLVCIIAKTLASKIAPVYLTINKDTESNIQLQSLTGSTHCFLFIDLYIY